MKDLPQSLQQSIENLYQVFSKYPLAPVIEGCPCCVKDDDQQTIHSKTLRRLSGEDLAQYAFKAMTTWGGADDLRHFLPRLLELVAFDKLGVETEIVFHKLSYADWQNWSEKEREAIIVYFKELFAFTIEKGETDAHLCGEYLAAFANAGCDLTPFLEMWLDAPSKNKILSLLYFVGEENYSYNPFLAAFPDKRAQIVNWLTSDQTIKTLEDLFFNDEQLKDSAEISELLELIAVLRSYKRF